MNRSVVQQTSGWSARAVWLAVLVVLVGLTGIAGRAQQGQGPGQSKHLFEARGEEADGASGQADRTKKRGRRVHVNAAFLQQPDAHGGTDIITLNLFDDVQLRARRSRLDPTRSGGTVWHGRLLDVAGEATIAVQDDVVSGTVFAGDKVFEVLYAGDGEHEVREIEPSAFPTDDPPADLEPVEPDPQAEAMDAAVAAGMAGDAASQVDVMVIWTPAARTSAGGTMAIQSLVNLAVANANTAYANSAVTQRLRLVYSGELSHTEGAAATDLSRLSGSTDGYLDEVHTLRNTYGADVVTLLGNGYACGMGYLMTYVSTGFASSAFNVVDRTCAAGNLTYAHELGHNMGLQHDPNNASSNPAYSYAYGYQQPAGAFRTVMAYPCPTGSCPRLMYFANPSVNYSGMPTGTASQNTAQALNNTASAVANFRQAVTGSCSYSLSATSGSVGSGTATSSVGVTAGSGCAWTATSNVSWLTITSGSSGTGSGTVSLSVAANVLGTSRTGTATIGGTIFTVTQSAAVCTYAITPGSASLSAVGGTGSFSLTTPMGCAAGATSSASWVTVTGGATGSASRTVSYAVAANAGGARSANISVGGQNFSISQAKKSDGSGANSAKADFNGDAMADLLWQHDNGAVGLWKMNGLSAGEIVMLTPGQVDPVWRMVGSGDLNGDGKPEIVWQHQTGGWLLAWFMSGDAVQQAVYLTPNQVSTAWRIVAITDINGDARADLIWQHDQGGLQVWHMNGTSRIGGGSLNPAAVDGNDWKIVGADDVNGDLKPDLVWQQSSTGLIGAWLMNGATATSFVLMTPSLVDRAWHIRGIVDLDNDGKTDLIWQHDNGALGVWLMAGTTATSMQPLAPGSVGAGWRLVGPR